MAVIFQKFGAFLLILSILACSGDNNSKKSLIDYIPENAVAVWKVKNFDALRGDLGSHGFLQAYADSSPFDRLQNNPFLKLFKPGTESLICLSTSQEDSYDLTLITSVSERLMDTDSLQDRIVETLTYNSHSIQRISTGKNMLFTAVEDSIFLASTSQKVLEQLLEDKAFRDQTFTKLYGLKESGELISFIKTSKALLHDSIEAGISGWTALDTHLYPNALEASGVIMAGDTTQHLLSVFKGLIPRENRIAAILPNQATGAVAFTFNDVGLLETNLSDFRGTTTPFELAEVFGSANEIGQIHLKQGNAVALKSIDPLLTRESLLPYITETDQYRDVQLFRFDRGDIFERNFAPLLQGTGFDVLFRLDAFFIFAESELVAQEIISAFTNSDCLANTPLFETTSARLSNASSLILYGMNASAPQQTAQFLSPALFKNTSGLSNEKYPLSVLQFIYDRNFAHVNLVCKEISGAREVSGSISERFSLNLEHPILGVPYFFSNHRTRGQDIAVQDINNKLYLISAGGKTLWSKQLDHPILGHVSEVDLLRNGKKQLAFATKDRVYVLDRNGKNVGAFPLSFKDDITQPLSIFDYDNNRKYRFLVTQGDEVFMFNSEGKQVKGFNFRKAGATIVQSPTHIRMGTKDYILIATNNGTLHILNRVGKTRIPVSRKFEFSEIPITREGNEFVVITKDHQKVSITQSGKISTQQLKVSNSYWFTTSGSVKVTLDDNLMRINGKLTELPFGIYSAPEIFTFKQQTYITITETQEKKVYLFDTTGSAVPGFPIYGSSTAALEDASGNGRLNLLTKGADQEILLYQLE